jgi:hypothetical protein
VVSTGQYRLVSLGTLVIILLFTQGVVIYFTLIGVPIRGRALSSYQSKQTQTPER